MVKQALKRRKPGFNESYYGFRSFNATARGGAGARQLLGLERDEKSGGYAVRLAAPEEPQRPRSRTGPRAAFRHRVRTAPRTPSPSGSGPSGTAPLRTGVRKRRSSNHTHVDGLARCGRRRKRGEPAKKPSSGAPNAARATASTAASPKRAVRVHLASGSRLVRCCDAVDEHDRARSSAGRAGVRPHMCGLEFVGVLDHHLQL